jgi:hypothetical protein
MRERNLMNRHNQIAPPVVQGGVVALLLLGCLYFTACGRPDGQVSTTDTPKEPPGIVGRIIHFDSSNEAAPYKVAGWSGLERKFTWTEGKAAVLALPVSADAGAMKLRLSASAFIHPPELTSQPVEVYANGEKIADWNIAGTEDNFATIPKEIATKATTLTVQFRTPQAASPAQFSPTADQRVLGLCCYELELTQLP